METKFQCSYACSVDGECDFYSYHEDTRLCSVYHQGTISAVYEAQGRGDAFHKGKDDPDSKVHGANMGPIWGR